MAQIAPYGTPSVAMLTHTPRFFCGVHPKLKRQINVRQTHVPNAHKPQIATHHR